MNTKTNIVNALLVLFVSLSLFAAVTAYAQTNTGSTLCGGDALAQLFCTTNLSDMLNQLFKLAIALGGVLAILRIGYGGYLYMGQADMWSTKARAKEVFRDAIIGLLLLLAVWLILYQINPNILSLQLLQNTGQQSSNTNVSSGNTNATPSGSAGNNSQLYGQSI